MVEALTEIPNETIGLIGGLGLGALFLIFLLTAVVLEERRKMVQSREREVSRREIAAYVAEGSISAEDGARLLADKRRSMGEAINDVLNA